MASITSAVLLLAGVGVLLATSASSTLDCGPNEHFEACGTCEGTCFQPNIDNCPLHYPYCLDPTCECNPGYVRSDNGTCIPTASCPPPPFDCPEGEVYTKCVSTCKPSCIRPYPIYCPAVLCQPGCTCSSGYERGADGKCIKATTCHDIINPCLKMKCKPNEVCVSTSDCPGCANTPFCIESGCFNKSPF
ncbi:hypothetical protein QR680_006292 [Steinernema hermaphroditum]|uniref:TIL domain-containing protein n=1 Tax=Steinernema hermaphroditum TaxID=289476 RepID=A0AA39LWA9_9BILA|nr:hypothetical protein QR680_006292 [Steinernema hermaphroditum]